MTAQAPNTNLVENKIIHMSWLQRLGLFLLFMVCEAAIFIFGSYYFDAFPTNKNLAYNLAISAAFLIATLWFRYDKRWNKHWQIPLVSFSMPPGKRQAGAASHCPDSRKEPAR